MEKKNELNKNLLISLVAGVIVASIIGITICVKHVINTDVLKK